MGLRIDAARCTGCGLCLKACAEGALRLENKKAVVDEEKCILCGLCAGACRFGALAVEKEDAAAPQEGGGVWVFAEQRGGHVLPVVFELLAKGRELADLRASALSAVLFSAADDRQANELIARGADVVYLARDARFADGLETRYAAPLARLVAQRKPEILLFGATGFGRSLAPRVAARLKTGLTADCTMLEIDEETGLLRQTRPAFGGNLMAAIICPGHRPQMATVRPGVFSPAAPDEARRGTVVDVALSPDGDGGVKLLEFLPAAARKSLADAKVIVSVGRGIGSPKNIAKAYALADLIGAQVGVSRPLVDLGWSEYPHQIGQTGCSVAPDLLIACGISGAIQHLAGIGGAKSIIAVNNDPDAPIFSVAQYKVVGDCLEVLDELISQIKKSRE